MAKPTKGTAAPVIKRGPGRPRKIMAPVAAPKLSKEALRDRVEKLERANAALRVKGKEAAKSARIATLRIAELEAEMAALTKQISPKAPRGRRKAREIDPGDAVPPGVAVQDPEPMDEEAETAFENLEEHLGASAKG